MNIIGSIVGFSSSGFPIMHQRLVFAVVKIYDQIFRITTLVDIPDKFVWST